MPEESEVSQEAHGSYIAQATHGASATVNVYASPPSLENQNRARFLVRLRTRYRELLSQSLRGAARMTLELAGHSEAVAPPVRLLYEPDQQPAHPLPTGISLVKVYEDAGQELLLLGEPGAGKSTLLLELASDLVGQAEQDPHLLLPVIVPLSSWGNLRQSLEQWLVEQVILLYDLPRRLATHWVQEERLLPLLDGLDEMEEEARAACIATINTYHREHLHPLVVASRKAEYEAAAASARLVLHSAVIVQPLTREQVDTYLVQCGEPVVMLRTALQENPTLQEITTTPLMLSILILTYQGKAVSELPLTGSSSEQQRQIFTRYVERMVARKEKLARSSPQELLSWLSWLARQMREHNLTIFYLEHLQPDWLPSKQTRIGYRVVVVLVVVLISVLVGGLGGILLSMGCFPSYGKPQGGGQILKCGGSDELFSSLLTGLLLGLFFGLLQGVVSARGKSHAIGLKETGEEIQFVTLTWQRHIILVSLISGLIIALVALTLMVIGAGMPSFGSTLRFIMLSIMAGIMFGVCYGLQGGRGISGKRVEKPSMTTPNQGIWHSAQSGALCMLSIALFGAIGTGLSIGSFYGLMGGLGYGLIMGLLGWTFGGGACIQHFALRWILKQDKSLPWHTSRFLEEATSRILLRRGGGGYSFPHRLLLDHFADLPEETL